MKTTTRSLFDGVPEAEKAKLDVKYTTVPRGTVIYSYGKRAKNALTADKIHDAYVKYLWLPA